MARRLSHPTRAVALALLAAVLLPTAAEAQTTYVSCWVEKTVDPLFGDIRYVTVCRLADGNIEEHPGEEPPGPLNPSLGNDATGECWYYTSFATNWMILSRITNEIAILGLELNGVTLLDTGPIPRCTSEPTPEEPPEEEAWEAITAYIHDPPTPELNPPIGLGLTGLETFAGVAVPGPWAETIVIPGYTLDVEVIVANLTIDWGDDTVDTYPPRLYERLVGYPTGVARHMYEVKTCVPPGRDPDCHPDHSAYPLIVSYEWEARWRINGGAWIPVDVPPSTTTVDYPVIEVVSVLTEVGSPGPAPARREPGCGLSGLGRP